MNEIVSIISNVGFPIAACVYVVRIQGKQIKYLTQVVRENTEVIRDLANKSSVDRTRKE